MVNVRFSNFDDFFNFLRRSPKNVQQILLKAYPEYTKQMFDAYKNTLGSITGTDQPKIATSKPKQITIQNISKATKGLGALGKKVFPVIGALGELPNVFNKDVDPKSRVLSGLSAASFLTGNIPGGIASALGSSLIKNSNAMANAMSDKAFNNWNNKFGAQSQQYDPRFIKLSKDELNAGYGNKTDVNNLVNDMNTLGNLEQQAANEQALTEQAKQNYEAALLNSQNILNAVPNTQLFPNNNLISNTPININPISGVQNGQEAPLNNQQVLSNMNNNKQPLKPNVASDNQLADYYRLGAKENLAQLENIPSFMTKRTPQDNSNLKTYLNLVGNQVAQQQLANQVNAARYQELINAYQQAVNRDRADAMINQLNTIANQYDAMQNRPVQYVGFDGSLKTIGSPQRQYNTNVKAEGTNVKAFADMLKLKEAQLKSASQQPDNDTLNKALVAQAIADRYGLDPLTLMGDTSTINTILQGENTIKNAELGSDLKMKELPYTTRADIIKTQADTAGKADIENLKSKNDYELAIYNQNQQNARQLNDIIKDYNLFNLQRDAYLERIRAQGANDIQVAEAKAKLDNANPFANQIKIFNAMSNFANNADAMDAWSMAGNLIGTNGQPSNQPVMVNGKLTPAGVQTLMRYKELYGN